MPHAIPVSLGQEWAASDSSHGRETDAARLCLAGLGSYSLPDVRQWTLIEVEAEFEQMVSALKVEVGLGQMGEPDQEPAHFVLWLSFHLLIFVSIR